MTEMLFFGGLIWTTFWTSCITAMKSTIATCIPTTMLIIFATSILLICTAAVRPVWTTKMAYVSSLKATFVLTPHSDPCPKELHISRRIMGLCPVVFVVRPYWGTQSTTINVASRRMHAVHRRLTNIRVILRSVIQTAEWHRYIYP